MISIMIISVSDDPVWLDDYNVVSIYFLWFKRSVTFCVDTLQNSVPEAHVELCFLPLNSPFTNIFNKNLCWLLWEQNPYNKYFVLYLICCS